MDWEKVTIEEVVSRVQYGYTESASSQPIGPKFLRITDIVKDVIEWDTVPYCKISDDDLTKYKLNIGDVVIARTGNTTGESAFIKKETEAVFASYLIRLVPNTNRIDGAFLGYLIGGDLFKGFVHSIRSNKTAQPGINAEDIKGYQFSLPPLPIQRRIASILSAYDDLIENNLRRIKLLEDAARCEYKILMEQCKDQAKLPISEVLEYYIGGGWGNDTNLADFSEPAFVIRGTDIPNAKFGDITNTPYRFHKGSNLASRKLQKGDIVFEVSGGSKTSPIGRALLITDKILDLYNADVMCASFCKLLRPNDKISPEYLYLFLVESYHDNSLKPYERPSASNIINFGFETYVDEATILLPDEVALGEFTIRVRNYLQMIAVIGAQNTQLRKAKDILLPKLMSGQIEVDGDISAGTIIEMPIKETMAAEDEVIYETKKSKPGAKYYMRTVLAAYIVDTLWQENAFGHVKLMKLMYLCEHLAGIETVSNYHRDAAGPYDNQMIRSIDKQLKTKEWFEMYKNAQGYSKYKPMAKCNDYKTEFDKYYSDKQQGIDRLLDIFGKELTEKAEMVATIYEAWRYLLSKQSSVSEDEVVNEVLNNWHESKKRISDERWRKCYSWMKQQNWIPN